MNRPSRLSMFVRELACRLVGHRWRNVSSQYRGLIVNGEYCTRCFDAHAAERAGQYPLRRA